MTSSLDIRIDREPSTDQVTARGGDALASAVLQRAGGFIAVVRLNETWHRLPKGVTDPAEQADRASRSAAALTAIGYRVTLGASLGGDRPIIPTANPVPLGDRVGELAYCISTASHTSEVAALLTEFTSPVDGILDNTISALQATADWWACLDNEPAAPRYAERLGYIAERIDGYVYEIGMLRDVLADAHVAHPTRRPVAEQTAPAEQLSARAAAARTGSPRAVTSPRDAEPATSETPRPTTTPRPAGPPRR
ncbi:hypothetical protein [Streptomyces aidingensis]|uniref:Uncharacterized protein n=1 Tax=Streptomyces aidingensis TaxID=910347 RepID=A0A1I1KHA5_9ACTN|nr:hypothetical protein [Streptomyces aidingensis]SFC59652.1 hypothetical protein SAMN05421773_104217 [Streptomyces aidingensis]